MPSSGIAFGTSELLRLSAGPGGALVGTETGISASPWVVLRSSFSSAVPPQVKLLASLTRNGVALLRTASTGMFG